MLWLLRLKHNCYKSQNLPYLNSNEFEQDLLWYGATFSISPFSIRHFWNKTNRKSSKVDSFLFLIRCRRGFRHAHAPYFVQSSRQDLTKFSEDRLECVFYIIRTLWDRGNRIHVIERSKGRPDIVNFNMFSAALFLSALFWTLPEMVCLAGKRRASSKNRSTNPPKTKGFLFFLSIVICSVCQLFHKKPQQNNSCWVKIWNREVEIKGTRSF